ncbi:hypothetical protein BU25DRAFT_217948 [Macroventuria anomochaeta]|uniref:Uncharacterized protein n=1 Tax=Macroventuria anomochaeta TaxID=301207 RepID=A0ACB6RJK2_9PLEO|nr:uncharacterized protein BU25DRAFT_217948 [Macroventuria anomochaeta]KAF2622051.1 hypothetical protein BU25DRAFT_217948 [Macroventuria anomochaeta]
MGGYLTRWRRSRLQEPDKRPRLVVLQTSLPCARMHTINDTRRMIQRELPRIHDWSALTCFCSQLVGQHSIEVVNT